MKKVFVLGGGESGVGAALLAKAKGFEVFLSDAGSLKPGYRQDLESAGIAFEEGGHTEAKLCQADEIIISPGIPEKAALVQTIKKHGIPLISEIEFASRYTQAKILAITGSNGKTTTTLLCHHLLQSAGWKVGLAGNIGRSFAKQVLEDKVDYYVLEISSFQLDRCYDFRPDVAILLNITPDHLDRYEYQFERYADAKFRMFQQMKGIGSIVYWAEDPVLAARESQMQAQHLKSIRFQGAADAQIENGQIHFKEGWTYDLSQAPIQGPHNAINLSAAILATRSLGLEKEAILNALPSFKNAEHRLEPCGFWKGIRFINDSKATNVDSVYYALNSFKEPLILIMGGVDKGNDYSVLDALVKDKVKALICLGTNNSKLLAHFSSLVSYIASTNDLKSALKQAMDLGQPGDVVLLSPACASFDLFQNYEDRGQQFKAIVKELSHAN